MKHIGLILLVAVSLAACDSFTPREKVAVYNPETGEVEMPYPCPDWSQSQVHNYGNQWHSNYGCAVNTNAAVQLENPRDLYRGHGDENPDTEVTTRVIHQYRAGDIPQPLSPLQSTGASTSQ